MNTISLFFGIRIMMDFSSNKPVFTAEYAGDSAQINIVDGTIISGFLPERQLKLVLAWND